MSRVGGWIRSCLIWTGVSVAIALLLSLFALHPPMQLYYSPLTLQHPYAHLPTWGVQELYHNPVTRSVLFDQHQDRVVDWAQPSAFYQLGEKIATWSAKQHHTHETNKRTKKKDATNRSSNEAERATHPCSLSAPVKPSQAADVDCVSFPHAHISAPRPFFPSDCRLAVTLPAKVVPAPLHLVHLLQGPAQLQVLRSLVLLGVPDVLADRVLSLNDLHTALLANAEKQEPLLRAGLLLESADAPLPSFAELPLAKLERLMSFALSIGYFEEISYRGSHIYVHNAQSVILRKDHPNSQRTATNIAQMSNRSTHESAQLRPSQLVQRSNTCFYV